MLSIVLDLVFEHCHPARLRHNRREQVLVFFTFLGADRVSDRLLDEFEAFRRLINDEFRG
jgi:hypothetical protein